MKVAAHGFYLPNPMVFLTSLLNFEPFLIISQFSHNKTIS